MKGLSGMLVLPLLLGGVVGAFYLQRYFMVKAMEKVVKMLLQRGATTPDTAISLVELGLARSRWSRPFGLRDYKPQAARMLIQNELLIPTAEGTVYLSLRQLDKSIFKSYAGTSPPGK